MQRNILSRFELNIYNLFFQESIAKILEEDPDWPNQVITILYVELPQLHQSS